MHATSRTRTFSKDQSGVILRTALRILEKWKATTEQAISILRVSRSSISRIQQGKGVELDCDQLERASIVLNCHASLRLVFDNPENVYGFVGMENHNDFFNGRKPLEIMAQGDLMSLLETYKRIVEFCGAGELISSSSPWGGLK
ncbi:antitoxin Xre-like helix-turn-helix domain-containing protein [Pseudomonas aeruginosa]|nr:hypothetical protein [Pseudomonas aeruginosa]EKW6756084.1 hypothetical protein [Pseudomonas aeruginosa]EKY2865954.1 hypothetical protein [Pseudomonas aeruginosa]ELI2560598.1 hypothetical protein [Pseudomonas aeruginosa]